MQRDAARQAGKCVAFLSAVLLFVAAFAALTQTRAHGAAHAAPPLRAEVAIHASGFVAYCVPKRLDCQAAAHAACCSMPGCSAPVASLATSHWLPDCARRAASVPLIVGSVPTGIGASPLIPPPRRPA